ncbi:hypothetical protein O3G_MSEX011032 [Manduca sexta]|uniref:DDE-1 domain-containing protein n=1 Tax=Manduca sexta TaxID=7130 RepID=A0A922CTD1_MANSE|nr:hypothetical protein O3G_MSEX011032 [Manduca sexta]
MLSLLPHTSHKMQPLDVSFYGPLKTAYKKECDFFMKSHRIEKITPYDVASLVKKAFNSVASISKGEAGFRSTGIFPLNPEVFTEEDFLAAEILQSENVTIHDCNESLPITNTTLSTSKEVSSPIPSTSKEVRSPVPITSKGVHPVVPSTSKQIDSPGPSISSPITLHDLISYQRRHILLIQDRAEKSNMQQFELQRHRKKTL